MKKQVADYRNAIMNLILDDLKIQKHLHGLYHSGLDTTPLNTSIHESLFLIMGLEKEQTERITEWYNRQAEQVYTIDVVNRGEVARKLAEDIFNGLVLQIKPVRKNRLAINWIKRKRRRFRMFSK